MSGLTVFHRFSRAKEMVESFNLLKVKSNRKVCSDEEIMFIDQRWNKTTRKHSTQKFIADEFRLMCKNYAEF